MGTLFSVVHPPEQPIAGDLRIRPLLAEMSRRRTLRYNALSSLCLYTIIMR